MDRTHKPRPRRTSGVEDLAGWLWQRRLWWLLPLVLSIVIVGALVWLGGTAAAPFIYPLF
jgi:hypothetical protein